MPLETVRYQVSGANGAAGSIEINVSPNGDGIGTVSLTGQHAGVDNIVAYLDSHTLTSNTVQATWQAPNGPIATYGPVSCYTAHNYTNGPLFPTGVSSATFGSPLAVGSLMFGTHGVSSFPGYTENNGGNTRSPVHNNGVTSTGAYSGSDILLPELATSGHCEMLMSLTGSFIVAAPGRISFSAFVNSAFILSVQGASYVSGKQSFNGVNTTPILGYAAQVGNNNSYSGGNSDQENFTLSFPAAGIYSYEIAVALGGHGDDFVRQFSLLANGVPIPPASVVSSPQAPAPGSGQLVLTANAGSPYITGSTQVFTAQVSGLTFETTSYLGLLENVPGFLQVTNNASNPSTFTVPQQPNGQNTTSTSAVANAIFSLSGDNGSWQGKLAISWSQGTCPLLAYNGTATDPGIASTALTVQKDDISWFSNTSGLFDLYTPTSQGGGSSATIQVYWLVAAMLGSVAPTTIPADGGQHTLAVNLLKPLPPIQANVTANFEAGASMSVVSSTAVSNSAGWITGWAVTVQTTANSQGQSALVFSLSGQLTYLSGTAFVTENYSYIHQSTAITLS